MTVETADLRPGHRISRVIKGGWQLAGDHGEVRREQAIADMEAFLDAGITTFDCADIYTGVEEMIGHFIADVRNRRGAEVACPDPHCGGRFRIIREGKRWYSHAATTGLPDQRSTPYWQEIEE